MAFEYGCSTTNKFCFLDENEVEDPSDLLAQVNNNKEQAAANAKDAKAVGKDGKAKPKSASDAKTTKTAGGKDAKKQPLQQQTDNSVKKTGGDDLRKDGKTTRPGQPKSAPVGGNQQAPKEDKENTSRQGQRPQGDQPRRPRPEGGETTGYRGNQDGPRPPRQNRPRPEGGQQGDQQQQQRSGPRPDRPPRQNRPRPQQDGFDQNNDNAMITNEGDGSNVQGGEGGEGRVRPNGGQGGYRGPRTGGNADRGMGSERRGGYRGGAGGAGGNGGGFRQRRTNDPDHPREFDRHSGSEKTGIKAVDKKEGAGKGNWGTAVDELAAEGEVLNDTQGEQSTENQNWAERVDESEETKREDEEPAEQHPNFMTLDEYKALKNQVNKKNDFNIRKPGEGEDLSKWGKTYLLPKKPAEEDEEDEEEEEEQEEEEEEQDAEDEKKKQLLNSIQIKFYDSGADRRGDRGDRGDRRQGGDRGDRRQGDRGDRGGAPRRPRPQQEGGDVSAAVPASSTDATAAPVTAAVGDQQQQQQGDVELTSSPSVDKPRPPRNNNNNNRQGGGQQQQQRGGNQQQRRGPRDGQFGGGRGSQKAAPKFDDEKDFPSLGK